MPSRPFRVSSTVTILSNNKIFKILIHFSKLINFEFFKYVTQIANYDALGGSSETSNEGVIPVSSVIGSLGDNGASGVLTDASGSVNIVGTGGVPTVDAGASYDAEGSQRQVISTVTTGTNAQATYLPVKPVRK